MVACWSVKGGSGVSVVAAALACGLAEVSTGSGSLLVDLDGDGAAVLGVAEPVAAAQADSTDFAPEITVRPGVGLLSYGGSGPLSVDEVDLASAAFALETRPVVVDCGLLRSVDGAVAGLAGSATLSLLVIRPCYLALRRAMVSRLAPSGLIVVREPGRALRSSDVAEVVGAPVLAEVPHERAVARAVDAGLLARRMPAGLTRALQPVVERVAS